MKPSRIMFLLLVLSTLVQASPHHRYRPYPRQNYHYYRSYYPLRYSASFYAYNPYRYLTPVIITSEIRTTYPTNLQVFTARQAAGELEALNELLSEGKISEKDFERSKKTLLNRIGMTVNPHAENLNTLEIIAQIEILYDMRSKQLLTEREYQKQKKKLLAMI